MDLVVFDAADSVFGAFDVMSPRGFEVFTGGLAGLVSTNSVKFQAGQEVCFSEKKRERKKKRELTENNESNLG